MKIKIGDKVRFLNDVGEGRVVRLLSDNTVEVSTPDGWDIPYRIHELIVIPEEDGGEAYKPEPFENKVINMSPREAVSNKKKLPVDSSQILLLIIQDKEKDQFSGVQLFLVNDSDLNLDYIYFRIGIEKCSLENKDTLEPGTKIFLDKLNLEDLSSLRGWQIQGILSIEGMDSLSPVINKMVPFQTKKFASPGAYKENDYLHEPAMVLGMIPDDSEVIERSLESLDINGLILQKEKENLELNKPKPFQTANPDRPPREIDLHVNKLIDRVVGLSNREILNIQMETFYRELNLAISSKERSIIFIHGIGNGTLKKELYKSITNEYPVCSYEDAPYKEYGYGATLVRIRQNK